MQEVAANPQNMDATIRLGEALISVRNWEAAETFAQRAMTLDLNNSRPVPAGRRPSACPRRRTPEQRGLCRRASSLGRKNPPKTEKLARQPAKRKRAPEPRRPLHDQARFLSISCGLASFFFRL